MAHQIAGRLKEAESIFSAVLERRPAHATANYCLGMLYVQSRRLVDGLPHLLAALNEKPDIAEYWLGYLDALLLLGEPHRAAQTLASGRQHGLAGSATEELARRLETALSREAGPGAAALAAAKPPSRGARRREALAVARQEVAVLALVKANRFSEALPLTRTMIERFPEHGVTWKLFAAMSWAAGATADALPALHKSAELLPCDAEAHANLGTALNKLQRLDDAEKWLRSALAIDADFAPAHTQLGDNYQLQGRYADAEASFRRAIALHSKNVNAETDAPFSSLLFMLNHNPEVTAEVLFEEHCRVGHHLEQAARRLPQRSPHDRDPDRPLRIGFVSADLRNHAVTSFIEPLLEVWSHSKTLEITIYHCHPAEDDDSRRLRGYVTHWRPVFGLSNESLAQTIADERIDILIDLAGHTSMHRLGTFAHKPAPVQATWLGYPATSGLRCMDYYITDRHFFPPGKFDSYFTEKLAYLPTVWPFRPFAAAPPVNPLPATTSGVLTFGSFNRLGKINEATIKLWARLLGALPHTRMIVAGVPLERQHHQLLDWFAAAGIQGDRLTFHEWSNLEHHLALHHHVDIALESTPYTGCTTSNHALWMGVPTLTLAGHTPASRLCAANLGHLNLTEFIANSAAEFVAKGLFWADHLEALALLRSSLRARWQASSARDPGFVAAGFELGLRRMWRNWCAGRSPQTFEIAASEAAELG